jgi:hypothetical protein
MRSSVVDALVGVLAALLVIALPPLVSLALALSVGGLALLTRLERVRDVGELFVVLTALTMPMNRLAVGSAPISDLLLLVALGIYVLVRLVEGRDVGGISATANGTYRPIVVGIVILAVGGLVGALFEVKGPFLYRPTGEPIRDVSGWGQNIGNLLKFVVGSSIPMAMWMLVRPDRTLLRRIVGAFVAGCAISAAAAYALPSLKVGSRLLGLTVHPGQFGSLSLLGMGAALALLLTQPRFRSWGYAVLPLLALGVLGSGSRAALGGLIVLGAIIGPATRSRAVMGSVMAGVAILLLVFAFGLVRPEGENALGRALGGESTAAGSNAIREDLGSRVLDRWEQRPITGNGYNYMRPSHNVYLGLLGSAGLLGIVGYGLVITTIARRTWRQRSDLLAVCLAAGYASYLAVAYFDNIFWWRWLWFYIGLVVAALATRPAPGEPGYEPGSEAGAELATASTR